MKTMTNTMTRAPMIPNWNFKWQKLALVVITAQNDSERQSQKRIVKKQVLTAAWHRMALLSVDDVSQIHGEGKKSLSRNSGGDETS